MAPELRVTLCLNSLIHQPLCSFAWVEALATYCYSLQSFYHLQKRETASEINPEKGELFFFHLHVHTRD